MASTGTAASVDIEKPVRAKYRLQIYLIVLANSAFLYGVARSNAISADGFHGLFSNLHDLVPVSFAFIIATVANGILSDTTKDRLVFLRWKHALPGHRAFSVYAKTDPRISVADLLALCGGTFPTDPVEQNSRWYLFYLRLRSDEAVAETNKNFMFTRDYAGLSVLFFLVYGPIGICIIHSTRTSVVFIGMLIIQYVLVRQAACNYGILLVRNVLARAAGLMHSGS